MLYYKTTQYVPGKGDAWMYYECTDDQQIRRYLTFIPSTREVDRVADPVIKKLFHPDRLMEASEEEFIRHWPEGTPPFVKDDRKAVTREEIQKQNAENGTKRHFDPDMTVGEAMAVHPKVAEVFAAFHLGGCSSCGISEVETVGQVCMGYGVDVDVLLEVLEGLMDDEENKRESTEEGETAPQRAAQ